MNNFRREAIERALAAYKQSRETRTLTIEYRGATKTLEVVSISPEVPLLNPQNSRLRAQLLEHPESNEVSKDPSSPASQQILSSLLAGTEKFGELKNQIVDYGQKEPGIISRDGLLVNGNTRLTAIRQLGLTGFDVAVLPDDATDEDFFQIEMSLQLRKLIHQDYTFTNELLLVDSYLKRTQNENATIMAMQWKRNGSAKLKLYQGQLALIDEIRALNPALKYSEFDKKAEFIKNLYLEYQKTLSQSTKSAEHLKQTRILGLFLGLNKDEIRETDENFLEDQVLSKLDSDDLEKLTAKYSSRRPNIDPLSELLDPEDGPQLDLRSLVTDVAQSVVNPSGAIDIALVEAHHKRLHTSYRTAARAIREERINAEARSEPIEYLRDVTSRIQELADRIPLLTSDSRFEAGKFQFQAKKTSKAIAALQDALNRL